MSEQKLSDVLSRRPVVGWTNDNKPTIAVTRAEVAALEAKLEAMERSYAVACPFCGASGDAIVERLAAAQEEE